jgi:hypothetical protein
MTEGSDIADILRMFSCYTAGLARRSYIYDVRLGNVNGRGSTLKDIRPMDANQNNQYCKHSRFPHTSPLS